MSIGSWMRSLWRPLAGTEAPPVEHPELARLIARAEDAYDKMYDARRPKDCYEAAVSGFAAAIAEAERLGLGDEVARLTERRDHVRAVYDSQFRGSQP